MRSVLVWLMVLFCCIPTAPQALAAEPECRPAELFATDNTAVITEPASGQLLDELRLFELQADLTLLHSGTAVTGSTLVDGVFWSPELRQSTYERAREFHLCVVDGATLHAAAEAVRRQFCQEAVLTFAYLPQGAPEADAIIVAVPGIDLHRFRAAFMADSGAHQRLLGGSVTTADHTLILVADQGDLGIARRLAEEAGGHWEEASIAYGRREFVSE